MVSLNSIKMVHFPIIHCFYWTPSWLNRMVLLNTVNFWKGSKANVILILMFWEYQLRNGGDGMCWGGLAEDQFCPEMWQDVSYLIMTWPVYLKFSSQHVEWYSVILTKIQAANSERVRRETKTILQINYFILFTVCFPYTRELCMSDLGSCNYIK